MPVLKRKVQNRNHSLPYSFSHIKSEKTEMVIGKHKVKKEE